MTKIPFSLNSPRYPLKSIPEPFFCKTQGYAQYRAPNMNFFLAPSFLTTSGEFLRSARTHDEKFCAHEKGQTWFQYHNQGIFSQNKNPGTYVALNRQKTLLYNSVLQKVRHYILW